MLAVFPVPRIGAGAPHVENPVVLYLYFHLIVFGPLHQGAVSSLCPRQFCYGPRFIVTHAADQDTGAE